MSDGNQEQGTQGGVSSPDSSDMRWLRQLTATLDEASENTDELTRMALRQARARALAGSATRASGLMSRRMAGSLLLAATVACMAVLLAPDLIPPAEQGATATAAIPDAGFAVAWTDDGLASSQDASLIDEADMIEQWEMLDALGDAPDAS